MLLNSGEKPILSEKGLLTTIGISTNNKINYALEGSVFAGGTVIKWLRDNMGVIKNAAESEYVARSIPDNGGVYIVPAFVGLGTPHWDSDARGTIMGLTFGNDTRHIVRAGLEAIAYQCYDVISVMEKEMGKEVIALKVDGGAALNDFLMEFQSAILNKKIYRPVVYESTAYGVYILSILNLGIEKDLEQIKNKIEFNRIFEPTEMSINREKLLKYWSKALERAKNWLE
jgi:glycerol kinase